ncbi:MAG: UvrD-helicase domain-containing protein, partial [Desulfobacteraceae bacterium]|nr:UvrD-helicase domain-containing protein [Desulfobacteraceae bacterium]
FYVGDKKQAIYRFRGGEVQLFDELKQTYAQFSPHIITLQNNFRSQKQIVEFNNRVFSAENLRRFIEAQQPKEEDSAKYFSAGDIEEIAAVFKDSQQAFRPEKDRGCVRVEIIESKDADERDELTREKVIGLIRGLKERFALKDIAVLCRSNKEIEQVTGWLIEEKIDVESERTLNIKNNSLIKELIAFLRFLDSPVDNLNFSAFITGEIFSRLSNIAAEKFRDFLFELRERTKADKSFYLYREFQRQYADIWDEYIAEFHKNVGLVPLYELSVSILEKFKIFKNFADSQGFFMRFLELIKEEEEEHAGMSDFLEFLDVIHESRLFVSFSGENAIKLLTIHKAKGLGFRVQIVPFLEMDIMNTGRQKKVYIVYEAEEEAAADTKIGLLRLDTKYVKFSPALKKIYHREYLRSFIDELNTLYVSLTRAKDELYLFIPYGMPRTNNIAKLLIPEDLLACGEISAIKDMDMENSAGVMPIPVPEYKHWISFLKEEFMDKEQIKNKALRESGNFLHCVLSRIKSLNNRDFKQKISAAVEFARAEFPFFKEADDSPALIEPLLKSESVKPFFYIDEERDEVYQEKELVNRFGHTKRVDRLIVKPDRVLVVDFKSAAQMKEEFTLQVQEYMRLLAEIYPRKKIEGYIILLESRKVEKIDA